MLTCPMCRKTVRSLARECPTCQADLGILVDYLGELDGTLQQAEDKTRAGKLGEAVWAYLEILEVDPDNPAARKQVAQVVTAVRQFDELLPGRRWVDTLRRQAYWRGWKEDLRELTPRGWLSIVAAGLLLVVTLLVGYSWGFAVGRASLEPETPSTEPEKKAPAPPITPTGKDRPFFPKGGQPLGK